ncbi:glycoside hydrolase family 10 protein [soil metagenome]
MKIQIVYFSPTALVIFICAVFLNSQTLPKVDREFRAVWVATVDNIDFPTKKDLTIAQQKVELIAMLDLAKKVRLNAVIFQVRPMADAVYASKLEPWSEFLTGNMGTAQAFDPLEFLVAEAHKRGILVHAWFNPYRAFHPAAKTVSDDHLSKKRPDLVRSYGKYLWLDPTEPEVRKHSLDVILDVVKRYDIDGVHFDDYFYPYPENDPAGKRLEFPDDKRWSEAVRAIDPDRNGQSTGTKRDDWRRANVDLFIQAVGREIKRIKPDIVYGVSPFGIWQPVPEREITGFNAYKELYADARKWLRDGTVDYLAPQLYWETAKKGQSFPVLLDWWQEQNIRHSFIWPGVAAYRIGSTPTFNADEIASQIEKTRRTKDSSGAIFFSEKSLRNDLGGIQNVLRDKVYKTDAIIPAFEWIKTEKILPPVTTLKRGSKFVRVTWRERGKRKAFWFVVYAKDKDGWSHSVVPASEHSISLTSSRKVEKVIVKSVDRLGNESN